MPTAKTMSSLAGLIDSDLEDDILHDSIEMMPTPDSNQENLGRPKRATTTAAPSKDAAKMKAPAAKGRKVKPASRRLSGSAGVTKAKSAAAAKTRGRRAPLKEQANQEFESDTEEVDEFQAAEVPVLKDKPNVPAQEQTTKEAAKKQPAKRGRKPIAEKPQLEMAPAAATKNPPRTTTAMQVDGEFEYTPTTSKTLQPKPTRGAGRPTARNKRTVVESESPHEEIPETQADPMAIDPLAPANEAAEDEDEFPTSVYKRVNHARAYSKSRQPSVARVRAGSNASDGERTSNADLRRKLGEMTKKFDGLEVKYRNLREVGVKEAEANFEKLKKASEHRAKTSDALISTLRASLTTQTNLAAELPALKSQIATLTTQLQTSASQTAQLNALLSSLQTENQTLMAKLAASRSAASAPPSSAVKPRQTPGVARGNAVAGGSSGLTAAAAAEAATLASMKEDLYSDFTGLIVRNIERHRGADEDAVDVYDCLQTGRNGTLHFHLAIPALDAMHAGGVNGPGKPRMSTFEEQEFTYTPKLDEGRDRGLIEILPEYMQEEITFSRGNAGRFYARVVGVLMRRVEEEDE